MQKSTLSECRLDLGFTQQELAERLSCTRNYIAMVESGVKPFSDKLKLKLSNVLPKSSNLTAPPGDDHEKARREVEAIKKLLGVDRDEDVMPKICELVQWKLSEQDRIIRLQRDELKSSGKKK